MPQVADKNDFDISYYHADDAEAKFHVKLTSMEYQAPPRFCGPGDAPDFAEIGGFLKAVAASLDSENAEQIAETLLRELGVTPANWVDFQTRADAVGSDVGSLLVSVCLDVASKILDKDYSRKNKKASRFDDEPHTLRAARFLAPLVQVGGEDGIYGIRSGRFLNAPKISGCGGVRSGRALYERLYSELSVSLSEGAWTDGASGLCYAVEADAYALIADAGPARSVDEQAETHLDAGESRSTAQSLLHYEWRQISGSPVAWTSPVSVQTPSFLTPKVVQDGVPLEFEVEITDGYGNKTRDRVIYSVMNSVNEPPQAVITGATRAGSGDTVILEAVATDENPADTVTFQWSVKWEGKTLTPAVIFADARTSRIAIQAPVVAQETKLAIELAYQDDAMRAAGITARFQ